MSRRGTALTRMVETHWNTYMDGLTTWKHCVSRQPVISGGIQRAGAFHSLITVTIWNSFWFSFKPFQYQHIDHTAVLHVRNNMWFEKYISPTNCGPLRVCLCHSVEHSCTLITFDLQIMTVSCLLGTYMHMQKHCTRIQTWLLGDIVLTASSSVVKSWPGSARLSSAQLPLHYVSHHLFMPQYFIDIHTPACRVMLGEIMCV